MLPRIVRRAVALECNTASFLLNCTRMKGVASTARRHLSRALPHAQFGYCPPLHDADENDIGAQGSCRGQDSPEQADPGLVAGQP